MQTKGQSAIEFLTTYSFLFLILGITVTLILFFATISPSVIPEQCSAYSGPSCNFLSLYTSSAAQLPYALATFSFTNTQAAPINISNVTITINRVSNTGACTPTFIYPGQETTCIIPINSIINSGSSVQGIYSINAKYCNVGLGNLGSNLCTYQYNVSYGGAFYLSATSKKVVAFSTIVARGPRTYAYLPYNALKANPAVPNNWTILQNSQIVTSQSGGIVAFAYSGGPFLSAIRLGTKVLTWPSSLSSLNSFSSCSSPYNSSMTIAYTTLYNPKSGSVSVSANADASTSIEVFYKVYNALTWNSVAFGTGWGGQFGICPPAGGVSCITNTINLNANTIYSIAVASTDACGYSFEAVNFTGLPT